MLRALILLSIGITISGGAAFAPVFAAEPQSVLPTDANEQAVPGGTIRSLPCQIIELPDQKITVCTENKGVHPLLFGPACGVIQLGVCWGSATTAPAMGLALPFVKLAKDRGAFRDLGNCEEIARNSGEFAGVLASVGLGNAGAVVGVLAKLCGECVCRAAY